MGGHAGRRRRARDPGPRRRPGRRPRDPHRQRGARRQDELEVGGVWVDAARRPSARRVSAAVPARDLPQHHHGQHRGAQRQGADVRGDGRHSGQPGLGALGQGAGPSHAFRRHPGHRRRLRLRRGLAAPRAPGHGTEPRQHAAHGPVEADRVGALRHPHPCACRRLRPGHRVLVVRRRRAPGHGEPVDRRPPLAGGCSPAREQGCDDAFAGQSRETGCHGSSRDCPRAGGDRLDARDRRRRRRRRGYLGARHWRSSHWGRIGRRTHAHRARRPRRSARRRSTTTTTHRRPSRRRRRPRPRRHAARPGRDPGSSPAR